MGVLLTLAGWAYLGYRRTVLSFRGTPPAGTYAMTAPAPVRVDIPSAGIAVPVSQSRIVDGVWQVSETGASHLAVSANPGQAGNIIIYGHNYPAIFGNLPSVRRGDSVLVTAGDGRKTAYAVREAITVMPDDLSVVMPTDTETLTLYTCTGFLDSQRFVVRAVPLIP